MDVSHPVLFITRVMMVHRENGCISLSVLSMARVMIAQWENECISLSLLSIVHIITVLTLFTAQAIKDTIYMKTCSCLQKCIKNDFSLAE